MWVSAMRRRAAGKRGFSFRLLGFEPLEDFDHLVNEGRGRRLSVARTGPQFVAAESFGTGAARRRRASGSASDGYALIRDWIRQGAPLDSSSARSSWHSK